MTLTDADRAALRRLAARLGIASAPLRAWLDREPWEVDRRTVRKVVAQLSAAGQLAPEGPLGAFATGLEYLDRFRAGQFMAVDPYGPRWWFAHAARAYLHGSDLAAVLAPDSLLDVGFDIVDEILRPLDLAP